MRTPTFPNEPFRPARRGFAGEHIFLEGWQRLLRTEPELIDEIFFDMPVAWNARAAKVAASFAKMLGTNWGANFLHQARRYAESGTFPTRRHAYLAAWALENERQTGINSGLRAVEAMLADQDLYGPHPFALGHELKRDRVPVVSLADLDVIECVVDWLSTLEGDQWARRAQEMSRAASEQQLREMAHATAEQPAPRETA